MTVAFEAGKEYLHSKCDHAMKPILESFFGELTVLGFVSLLIFLINKAGFFQFLGEMIYGSGTDEAMEMLELSEYIHIILFFVMIGFVVQVAVLIRGGLQLEAQLVDMDNRVRNWNKYTLSMSERRTLQRQSSTHLRDLLPMFRNVEYERERDLCYFKFLKEEFLAERSMEYPFEERPAHRRLQNDFNFGRYLSICLGKLLGEIVDLGNETWLFFALASALFLVFALIVDQDPMVRYLMIIYLYVLLVLKCV